MPFEPRIVEPPDDARAISTPLGDPAEPVWSDAAEMELPDDLAALAEQLRDDAVFLAQRHPAHATPEEREAAIREEKEANPATLRASDRRWYRRAAAAAAVLLVAAGTFVVLNGKPETSHPVPLAGRQHHSRSADALVGSGSEAVQGVVGGEDQSAADRSMNGLPLELPQPNPAAFLRDVSGPELDGMLDLLSEQATELSI